MGSRCTRRAWSGSMMGRFGCGAQVWRSETQTSHTGSARRDSPAPESTCVRARVLGQIRNGVSSICVAGECLASGRLLPAPSSVNNMLELTAVWTQQKSEPL
jgi:hypothetical protein